MWLAIIIIPVYYIVITTFKDQGAYFTQNPLALPNPPKFAAYQDGGRGRDRPLLPQLGDRHCGCGDPAGHVQLPGVVRHRPGQQPAAALQPGMFLLGLAIPLQATIIPIYLIIIRIQMYDSLGALILPSIAFGIPLTVLILSNFIRDVPAGAVRVDATGRLHRLADGLAAGVPADQAGHRDRQHL